MADKLSFDDGASTAPTKEECDIVQNSDDGLNVDDNLLENLEMMKN